MAADVSVVFVVVFWLVAPRGAAPRFSLNAPPLLTDSAARESLRTGPEGSLIWRSDMGSLVTLTPLWPEGIGFP